MLPVYDCGPKARSATARAAAACLPNASASAGRRLRRRFGFFKRLAAASASAGRRLRRLRRRLCRCFACFSKHYLSWFLLLQPWSSRFSLLVAASASAARRLRRRRLVAASGFAGRRLRRRQRRLRRCLGFFSPGNGVCVCGLAFAAAALRGVCVCGSAFAAAAAPASVLWLLHGRTCPGSGSQGSSGL